MKILFITSARGIDYQSDCLFHGLVSLGHEVTDTKYLWYLSEPMTAEQKAAQYGRGFTLAATLPDRSASVDRDGIADRIAAHEFDLVVYGSVARCADWTGHVSAHYGKGEVAVVDGEDDARIREPFDRLGAYFKRELTEASRALPISFAMPAEKFLPDGTRTPKERMLAELIPGRRETYRFTDETEYYRAYAKSRFGLTMKKAGWDCLRHYEIIGSCCLPLFKGMEACPKSIMAEWPWTMQMEVNRLYAEAECGETGGKWPERYAELLSRFYIYAKSHLTTEALAKRFIEAMCWR